MQITEQDLFVSLKQLELKRNKRGQRLLAREVSQVHNVVRLAAQKIGDQNYNLSETYRVPFPGRPGRFLDALTLEDRIVLGAVARKLTPRLEPLISECVFSYRKGLSHLTAVRKIAKYLQKGGKDDLWVVRADIKEFTDSIPLDSDAPIWPLVDRLANLAGLTSYWKHFISSAIRQTGRSKGVPMGSPIAPVIANLYLAEMDSALDLGSGVYARYGDDFIVVERDKLAAQDRLADAKVIATQLGLELNPSKTRLYCLAPGGANSRECRQFVDYLGLRLDNRGRMELGPKHATLAFRELWTRLQRCSEALNHLSDFNCSRLGESERRKKLVGIANSLIQPGERQLARFRDILLYTDSRERLRDWDHRLAAIVAEQLASTRGPRAFREFPPRVLRQKWGLCSLTNLRNGK